LGFPVTVAVGRRDPIVAVPDEVPVQTPSWNDVML
jgi:hypothetical protein